MTQTKNTSMRTKDMTTGDPIKLILAFAIPLFIGNIFQQVYTMVDTMVVGHILGDNAISAIGATSALYGLLISLASSMNSGYAIITTQAFGAHDEQRLRRAIAGTMILNGAATVFVTLLSIVFLRPLLGFMNTPKGIFEEAYAYIFVLCAGMFSTIGYNMFAGVLRAVGNSRTPLYYLIASSIINVVLDILFVAGLGMGVIGAAMATVIAQVVSAICCGYAFFHNYQAMVPCKEDFRMSRKLWPELLSADTAMALMLCVVNLGSLVFQRANNSLGEAVIAAHTAAHKIINTIMQPLGTIAAANAVMAMRISLPFFPILGILLCLRTAMQSMGHKTAPVMSSCVELLMKGLGASLLIPAYGYLGACITEPLTWTIMTAFLVTAYFIQRKKIFFCY